MTTDNHIIAHRETPFSARLADEITREMREREAITCEHRAICLWACPETCRQCQGENSVTVMAVGVEGLKHHANQI